VTHCERFSFIQAGLSEFLLVTQAPHHITGSSLSHLPLHSSHLFLHYLDHQVVNEPIMSDVNDAIDEGATWKLKCFYAKRGKEVV
jgi:hypothetical protein